MSEQVKQEWAQLPEEYLCLSCGEMSNGCLIRRQRIEGKPQAIRQSLKDSPSHEEITDWDDAKGCDVVGCSEINTPASGTRMRTSQRHGPVRLLCENCQDDEELTGDYDVVPLYWRIPTQHGEIWAYNRQHLVEIRDYIQLDRRPQGVFKLPGWVLASKNRVELVKLINTALEYGPPKF